MIRSRTKWRATDIVRQLDLFADIPSKRCSVCRVNPPKPNQRYCRECHAAYMRTWRQGRPAAEEGAQK